MILVLLKHFLACHDKGSCAEGALEGHCTQRAWQSWMNKACRFSCGFCKGKPNTDKGNGYCFYVDLMILAGFH